jgi:hypothetical protein
MKSVTVVQIENGWMLTCGATTCFCSDTSDVLDKIKTYLSQ